MRDVLAEFELTRPLNQKQIDWFTSRGVAGLNLAKIWDGTYSFVQQDEVVFLGDRFEFRRHLARHDGAGQGAFIFVLRDQDGEPADIGAWRPPDVATWLGSVAMFGEEQALGFRIGETTTLRVHNTVLSWFAAAREGVYIVDFPQAAHLLRNDTLGVLSGQHARELRTRLTLQAPPVVLLNQVERAA